MSVPKLRFKEFDGDWSESKLKDCIDSIDSGWSPQCESYPADENEWAVLKTTSVDWDGFKANFNKKLPSSLEARFEIEVKPNDILVTRAGPTERVGVVAVVPHNVRSKLMISDKLIRLKANNENNPEFLGISLSSVKCQNQLQSKTSGLAKSQTNISQKILCDVSLMTPAKAEQTKIASFLSNVDEKISQLTQKHQLLSQYKQGMMQKLFSQQIRFKADDGSEFGEWEEVALSKVSDVRDGTHDSPSYVKDGYPLITSKNLKNGKLDLTDINLISEDDYLNINKRSAVNIGDIIFGMIGTIGNPVLLNSDGFAIKNVALIKEKDELLNIYLIHYLNSSFFAKQVALLNAGNTQKFLALGQIRSLSIHKPQLAEQTKIANFLSAIDQKIEVVAQQIEQAKTWKKGLLQQMFV